MDYQPIAFARSCYRQKMATPRQSMIAKDSFARIEFVASVQPEMSLQGLADFSHLWLIFQFHENDSKKFSAKVRPPRLNGEKIGVFATRSPHRPNPIGLSLVRIEAVKANSVEVSGVDIIDGTPILDIKPYLAEIEAVPEASSGWVQNLTQDFREVEWAEGLVDQLGPRLSAIVEDTLRNDPRPLMFKKASEELGKIYKIRIDRFDVSFRCLKDGRFRVESISN